MTGGGLSIEGQPLKISAVSVASSDIRKTAKFYALLGFDFSEADLDEEHVEPVTPPGSARLMIDSTAMVAGIIGEPPAPGNASGFAVEYDTPAEVDAAAAAIAAAGFEVVRPPWDAFWGQRYAVVADPDGYRCDLYARFAAEG